MADAVAADASVQLRGLIDGLKYWTIGYFDWVVLDSKRYAADFAVVDADDRLRAC